MLKKLVRSGTSVQRASPSCATFCWRQREEFSTSTSLRSTSTLDSRWSAALERFAEKNLPLPASSWRMQPSTQTPFIEVPASLCPAHVPPCTAASWYPSQCCWSHCTSLKSLRQTAAWEPFTKLWQRGEVRSSLRILARASHCLTSRHTSQLVSHSDSTPTCVPRLPAKPSHSASSPTMPLSHQIHLSRTPRLPRSSLPSGRGKEWRKARLKFQNMKISFEWV